MIKFDNLTHLFDVDWDALQNHVRGLASLRKAGGAFGGWSVQSFSGSYLDGWVDGSAFMSRKNGVTNFNHEAAFAAGYRPNDAQVVETDASCPALSSVIAQMNTLGFEPRRARLIQLEPGRKSSLHTDGAPQILRMHFVIETNDDAWFRTPSSVEHLPARNVFLINVDDYHQVGNDGQTNRTHLVVAVKDTQGVSKIHASIHAR